MSDVPSGLRKDLTDDFKVKRYSRELRIDLTTWVLRDFATDGKLEKYQQLLLDSTRNEIIDDCRKLEKYIQMANSIYMETETDYQERRKYIQIAIGFCNAIKVELQFIINMYHSCININKYMVSIKKVELELGALKGWRKSCQKTWNKIKGNL